MRVQVRQDAPPGQEFTPGSFDHNVGRTVPFITPTGATEATVTAAQVAGDGSHVMFTLDLPEDVPELLAATPRPGVGFRPVWDRPEDLGGPPPWLRGFPSSFPPGQGPFDHPDEFDYPGEFDDAGPFGVPRGRWQDAVTEWTAQWRQAAEDAARRASEQERRDG